MFFNNLDGLIWLVVLLIPFNLIQKQVHKEIQTIFFLLTKNRTGAILLFSVIFLPGVFIHEISHFMAAKLLRVRTGGFSLLPKPVGRGQLQLGYVEITRTDWFRGSLIGVAPLMAGGSLIAYLATVQLDLSSLWGQLLNGQSSLFWEGFLDLPERPYFWLMAYLILVVSSTMMPSDSDRHAWLPLGLILLIIFTIVFIAGAGTWMIENLAPTINSLFTGLAMVIGLSGLLHILLYLPTLGIHKILVRITGYDLR
ncbi:hypothetical protein ACFLTX_03395 [Chloroflexota bacterium]